MKRRSRGAKRHGVFSYRQYKKTYCEECGFVATHPCQLDVDHADGNHNNNATFNLITLCANCHRLKTFLAKDWQYDVRSIVLGNQKLYFALFTTERLRRRPFLRY